MTLAQRIANTFRPATGAPFLRSKGGGQPPKSGRILEPRPEDVWRDYPSSNLTPKRLMAILREADDGSLSSAMQLYEEMEEKDPHLYAVANTRRLALTGLDWTIQPDRRVQPDQRPAADRAADYCRDVLTRIESFDDALQHLSLATGRNIAIAELVWGESANGVTLLDLFPVDFTRIVFDALDRPRILTEDEQSDGIELQAGKFIVHTPHCTTGHPARGGLLRVTALAYLAKNLALKDWMIFAEIFGMPVRIARYEPSASAEEKREMLDMLETLGSNAAGIFSRAVDLQIVETNRGSKGTPYGTLIEFLNREISKAWLGQTLTTDTTGARGSFAAANVHEQVRRDVLADDLRKEARTIRRDVLGPLTRFRFGPEVAVPHFRRHVRRTGSAQELAELLDFAVNDLGFRVPLEWAHESLGLPLAAADATVLKRKL